MVYFFRKGIEMKKIYLTILGLIILTTNSFAETIYLKDGQIIKGKVVERGNYYIKVMVGRYPQQIFNEQIEEIVEDEEPLKFDPSQIDAGGFDGISSKKVLLIVEHLEANGARYNMQRNMELILAQMPTKEAKDKIEELLNITDVINLMIPVYDQTYSEDDLIQINAFLKSPAGVKMIQAAPALMRDSIPIISAYFREKLGDDLKISP